MATGAAAQDYDTDPEDTEDEERAEGLRGGSRGGAAAARAAARAAERSLSPEARAAPPKRRRTAASFHPRGVRALSKPLDPGSQASSSAHLVQEPCRRRLSAQTAAVPCCSRCSTRPLTVSLQKPSYAKSAPSVNYARFGARLALHSRYPRAFDPCSESDRPGVGKRTYCVNPFVQGGTYNTPGEGVPASLSHLPPARIKRILANRESAARSKQRKLDYMMELEHQVPAGECQAIPRLTLFLPHCVAGRQRPRGCWPSSDQESPHFSSVKQSRQEGPQRNWLPSQEWF